MTHVFLFGVSVGILFGILIGYNYGSLGWVMGFIAGFGGTTSHFVRAKIAFFKRLIS
jgi:hypothetical protein